MAGCLHDAHHAVETDEVLAIGDKGEHGGIDGAHRGERIALDTRHLHQSTDRVVMFQPHLGSIFHLIGRAAHELAEGTGGHGTCRAHLSLTADLRPTDGGVVFDNVANESGSGKGMQNFLIVVFILLIISI